jgi:hypothetical protein
MGITSLPESHYIEAALAYPISATDVVEDIGYERLRVPKPVTLR